MSENEITESDLPQMNTPQTLKVDELKGGDYETAINGVGRANVSRNDGTTANIPYVTFEYMGATRKKFLTKSESLLVSTAFGKSMDAWVGKKVKIYQDLAKNPKTNVFQKVVRVKPDMS
jgi:hypothetical protein